MTPEQAIAIRALWATLGENGNLLAASWSKLLGDVEPTELIKLAERLTAKLPKLYTDTEELIITTGHILEAEGDRLADLGAVPKMRGAVPNDIILDELLGWEAGEPSRSSSVPAGPAVPPPPSPQPAGTGGEPTTSPPQPHNGAQEAPNPNSGPPGPEGKVNGKWGPLARLLTEHELALLGAMAPRILKQILTELDELMQKARLWEPDTLTELGIKWLKVPNWWAVPSYDLRAFAQRVVIQATAEVEGTGLGARALAETRKETNHDL